ncbi:glutamate 5-kinase [bacterium]|nr:glutamate 5-kinase [bacterium]
MTHPDIQTHADLARFDPALLVIKLGSNVVTTDVGQLDHAVLDHVARFASERLARGKHTVIVSSGAVASGIGEMGLRQRPKRLPEKQALAAIGQGRLVAHWADAFGQHDRHVAQILLTAKDFDDRRRYLNIRYTLERLFGLGVVPIVNENDTVTVDELRFGDNDDLALLIAIKMLADCLILLTSSGLCRQLPAPGQKPEVVEVVGKVTPEIEAMVSTRTSSRGSGGMANKIHVADQAARSGIPTLIAPGKQPGILDDLFAGKGGATLFPPRDHARYTRRQRFIAFSRITPRGRVWIDEGAVRALITAKKSLLPAGVRRTEGDYARQDVIEVLSPEGRPIARGLTNYNAREVAAILGKRTTEIEKILGQRDYDEIIHRDNLVVLESNG